MYTRSPDAPPTRPEQARRERGTTLVELIVALFVMVLMMGAMAGLFLAAAEILSGNKARAGAITLAQDQVEYLRSLSYFEVGTVGGIPPGVASSSQVIDLNGVRYTVRTLIQYVDDPEDGLGGADATGVTADYKRAKVEVSWLQDGETASLALVTNIVPVGIESLSGGGTLRLSVIDPLGSPIQGALVEVDNTSIATTVDTSALTNADGDVIFPGAPVGTGYEISVSRAGYSSAQTHTIPGGSGSPSPLSVVDGASTPETFIIDELATLTIETRQPVTAGSSSDTFLDPSGLSSLASTTVAGGVLTVASTSGLYPSAATATSVTIAPGGLASWRELTWSASSSASSTVRVRVLTDAGGTFAPLSDAILPGNSGGFSGGLVDLSGVDPAVHDALRLEARFLTSDPSTRAELSAWALSFDAGLTPEPNVAFAIQGARDIGSIGATPVLKFDEVGSTDAGGQIVYDPIEFDSYTVTIDPAEGLDVAEYCPEHPIGVSGGEDEELTITVVPDTAHSALVRVTDDVGDPLPDASVTLARPGLSEVRTTTSCGQAHFAGLVSATDYELEVTHPSFSPTTRTGEEVAGDTTFDVSLVP
ncbi:hypothetical protein GVX82_01610 [Patescibacteria group bacterium]|jgi:hypothetical protein|nr:hypothetical protein [Patescibacteria group bacterium]